MLGELKTEAEDSLSTMRKGEMESNHKFEMLKMSLETELKNMKERLSDATNERSGEEQSAAGRMEFWRAVSIFGRSRTGCSCMALHPLWPSAICTSRSSAPNRSAGLSDEVEEQQHGGARGDAEVPGC